MSWQAGKDWEPAGTAPAGGEDIPPPLPACRAPTWPAGTRLPVRPVQHRWSPPLADRTEEISLPGQGPALAGNLPPGHPLPDCRPAPLPRERPCRCLQVGMAAPGDAIPADAQGLSLSRQSRQWLRFSAATAAASSDRRPEPDVRSGYWPAPDVGCIFR